MINVAEFVSLLRQEWGSKTLEELRVEAERNPTGLTFESMRVSSGQRVAIVLCLTEMDDIAEVERAISLIDRQTAVNWNELTLSDLVAQTAQGRGLCYEALRDEFGRRSALILVATAPDAVAFLEKAFNLPK